MTSPKKWTRYRKVTKKPPTMTAGGNGGEIMDFVVGFIPGVIVALILILWYEGLL